MPLIPVARRRAPLLLAPLLLVGGCASAAAPETAAEGATAPVAEGTHEVTTAFGEVTVPAEPTRVVALGDTALDTAVALGVSPVATLASRGGDTVSDYLADEVGDVAIVGTVRETNLEAVVEARPDLILAASGTEEAQYEALSAIAPTVVPETPGFGEWEADVLAFAEALGEEERAQALLDEIEARTEAIAAESDGGTAAVVRWMPDGPLVMSAGLMAGRLVTATGQELPEIAQFSDRPHTDPLSLESLGAVDVDIIYVATLNEDGEGALRAAQEQPAFARLRAAQSGDVVPVDGGVWSSAAGLLAADAVLDDIEAVHAAG